MKLRQKIKVPAQPGDVVLLTPGALDEPRVQWWRFEMDFGRPDGTRGTSKWLIASHKYATKHNFDAETFQVIGDITWRHEFTSKGGAIDPDAIELWMKRGDILKPNPSLGTDVAIGAGLYFIGIPLLALGVIAIVVAVNGLQGKTTALM